MGTKCSGSDLWVFLVALRTNVSRIFGCFFFSQPTIQFPRVGVCAARDWSLAAQTPTRGNRVSFMYRCRRANSTLHMYAPRTLPCACLLQLTQGVVRANQAYRLILSYDYLNNWWTLDDFDNPPNMWPYRYYGINTPLGLMKRSKKKKKIYRNYPRILRINFNRSWTQYTAKEKLYDHLPPISQTI